MEVNKWGPLAGISCVAAGALLYKCVRPRFNVRVNCWFCDQDTVVPYGNKHCWDCPYCEQYNGFTEDGGYNKPIPLQYSDILNHPVPAEKGNFYTGNGLCEHCNRNQLLKVKNLSNFVPYNELNFEAEVEAYRQQLEYTYRLCRLCEARVSLELSKQDKILYQKMKGYKLNTRKETHVADCVETVSHLKTPYLVHLLQFIALFCATLLFITNGHNLQKDTKQCVMNLEKYVPRTYIGYIEHLYHTVYALVAVGLSSCMGATFLGGKHRICLLDALCAFLWLFIAVFQFNAILLHHFHPSAIYVIQTVLSLLTLLAMLWITLYRRPIKGINQLSLRRTKNNTSHRSTNISISNSPPDSAIDGVSNVTISKDSDLDSQLETMSIGSPSPRSRGDTWSHPLGIRAKKSYSQHDIVSSPSSNQHSTLDALMMRQNWPLIRPARFKLQTPVDERSSSLSCSDKNSLNVIEGSSRSNKSSRSSSSVCPVDTTCPSEIRSQQTPPESKPGRSVVSQCILGVSLGLNIFLAMYLIGGHSATSWLADYLTRLPF